MPLIACPECQKQIPDQAVSCPSCGFPTSQRSYESSNLQNIAPLPRRQILKCPSCGADTDPETTKCRFCGTHLPVLPSSPSEADFKDHGLQIVGLCERALNIPRLLVESIIADAESQFARLRAKHRVWLNHAKYKNVEFYIFSCISKVRIVKMQDDHAIRTHGDGGVINTVLGFAEELQTDLDIQLARAYMSDLRIMLGADSGVPNAVERFEAMEASDANPPEESQVESRPKWLGPALIGLILVVAIPIIGNTLSESEEAHREFEQNVNEWLRDNPGRTPEHLLDSEVIRRNDYSFHSNSNGTYELWRHGKPVPEK